MIYAVSEVIGVIGSERLIPATHYAQVRNFRHHGRLPIPFDDGELSALKPGLFSVTKWFEGQQVLGYASASLHETIRARAASYQHITKGDSGLTLFGFLVGFPVVARGLSKFPLERPAEVRGI